MLGHPLSFKKLLKCLVGLLWVFSGLVKLNDPVGFGWTLDAYLASFAEYFTPFFLNLLPFTLGFAVGIATLECVLGVALLVGFRLRITLLFLLGLITCFLGLNLYTAITKRLVSCGCFGDVVQLTPWQSFGKSVLLLGCCYKLYQCRGLCQSRMNFSMQWGCVLLAGVLNFMLGWYTSQYLPVIEFGLYKPGSNLVALSQPSVPLRYTYILEKDGKQITSLSYPDDETYRLLGTKLLNPAARPLISDLAIWTEQGEITTQVLQGTKLLVIILHPTQVALREYARLATVLQELSDPVQAILLLPFGEQKACVPANLANALAWAGPHVLKAMLKAKQGFVLLHDGQVVNKWPYHSFAQVGKALVQVG